ncbi:MAG TPA: hypothetical protein VFR67_13440 [Pilimelia sp.]|nr:hypothetical protein [Pilimelia sp.]
MPAPDSTTVRLDGRLLNGLFWAGVGLAPLAALLLLIGQDGGPLRVAVVLALLAVILIGLSITLRGRSKTMSLEFEDQLLDEIEALRRDVREDIATAARATHRAFGEKLQVVYQTVEALRAQMEAARAADPGRGGFDRPAAGSGSSGVYSSAGSYPSTGSYPQGGSTAAPGPPPAAATGPQPDPGHTGSAGRGYVPGGVVRHTETVQVTTRQTIVDPLGDDPNRGTVYGGGGTYGMRNAEPASGEWSAPGQRSRRAEPDDDSWRDQRYEPRGAGVYGREEPTGDGRYSELRMGERRAAMRADDTGTELRIEDRWAAVRRDDGRRDEARWDEARWEDARRDEAPRSADRWSEQRARWDDDQPRWSDGADRRGDEPWRGEERTGTGRWGPAETGSWNSGDGGDWNTGDAGSWGNGQSGSWREARWDRALPPGGIEVTGPWTQGWIESEREPVRDQRRDGGYDGWR